MLSMLRAVRPIERPVSGSCATVVSTYCALYSAAILDLGLCGHWQRASSRIDQRGATAMLFLPTTAADGCGKSRTDSCGEPLYPSTAALQKADKSEVTDVRA